MWSFMLFVAQIVATRYLTSIQGLEPMAPVVDLLAGTAHGHPGLLAATFRRGAATLEGPDIVPVRKLRLKSHILYLGT